MKHLSNRVAGLLFLLLAAALLAPASTVDFAFDATLQTGSLAGTSFAGTGSYDNAALTGAGTEYAFLTALDFTVDGALFSKTDIDQGGQAVLQDGTLDYFTAAFFPSSGPFNDLAFGFGGPGVIGYSAPPVIDVGLGTYTITSVETVPEPAALLLGAAGFSAMATIRRRRF
jgi:hypothetical protein